MSHLSSSLNRKQWFQRREARNKRNRYVFFDCMLSMKGRIYVAPFETIVDFEKKFPLANCTLFGSVQIPEFRDRDLKVIVRKLQFCQNFVAKNCRLDQIVAKDLYLLVGKMRQHKKYLLKIFFHLSRL